MARKLRLAILCNLREKSSPKIKNWKSYINPRHLIAPFWRASPVCNNHGNITKSLVEVFNLKQAVKKALMLLLYRINHAAW